MHDPARTVVVFSGGGTGGHLYPALALADALVALRPDVHPVFVGARRGVEARVLPERGHEHLLLPVRGIQRDAGIANWRAVPALVRSLVEVVGLFRRTRPAAVVVTGGYAGGPAGIAAGALRTPLVLQEQNAVPGITTRVLARWARQVHLAFPEAADYLADSILPRVRESGNPVRPPAPLTRAEARTTFGLPEDATVVLVTGGSQGSRALNRAVEDTVRLLDRGEAGRPHGLHLLWVTGPAHLEEVRSRLGTGLPGWVRLHGYLDDMPAALAAADLAVSRAGAMTTAEFLNQGLPALLVPLPSATADHQTRNAQALDRAGAARVLAEDRLSGSTLCAALTAILGRPAELAEMATAARERARPQAAREIAADIASLLPVRDGAS